MTQKTILIVEDELIIAKDLQLQLRDFGYRVPETAVSGEEALEMMETVCPDLVMMDIVLQGELDGIEVAELIRKRFHIPVIYLTAYSDDVLMERAKLTEPFGYLLKPFSRRALHATIRMALYKAEMDEKLRESREWFSTTLMSIGDAVIATNAVGEIILMNPVAESLCEWTTEEARGKPITEVFKIINEGTRAPAEDIVGKVIREGVTAGLANHTILISRSGTEYTIEDSCAPIRDALGARIGVVLVFHDITLKKKTEEKLRKSRIYQDLILETARDAFIQIDMKGLIISWNRQAETTFGWTKAEVLGKSLAETIIPLDYRKAHEEGMKRLISTAKSSVTNKAPLKLTALHQDRHTFPVEISLWVAETDDIFFVNAFVRDISRQKKNEEQLHFRAYYDPLTQLPNRTFAFEQLLQSILNNKRYKRKAALLFIDLDHFKLVNDTLGHLIGDKVLVIVAGKLRSAVRETDTVARIGGDEFFIILNEITDQKEVAIVAEKILEDLSLPFQVDGHELFLGGSIGVAIVPDDGDEAMLLFQNADMAMYRAKSSGRNNFQFFNQKMKKKDRERTLLGWELRQTIKNLEVESHGLVLHYQPIIELSSLKTVSLEALIRWQHPKRGMIFPEHFIPIAEHSGMISKISHWVLLTACTQMKLWQDIYGLDTSIAVNLSSRDFLYGDSIYSLITQALEQSGLAAESLVIEITEGIMLDPNRGVLKKLQAIKDLGVRISIDDFGTGYSSLSYLSRYPIDLLKIDKSFIQGIQSNAQKKPLVEAILHMGKSMGINIIAEGVESLEELSYLLELGCEKAQGYYFSKALSVQAYEDVLKERKKNIKST